MKSEIIIDILIPKDESNFLVVKTNKNCFELRMGGYKLLEKLDEKKYKKLDQPVWLNKTIKRILTDDHVLYIENEDNEGFSYGFTFITGDGETSLALKYYDGEEFQQLVEELDSDEDFYEI